MTMTRDQLKEEITSWLVLAATEPKLAKEDFARFMEKMRELQAVQLESKSLVQKNTNKLPETH